MRAMHCFWLRESQLAYNSSVMWLLGQRGKLLCMWADRWMVFVWLFSALSSVFLLPPFSLSQRWRKHKDPCKDLNLSPCNKNFCVIFEKEISIPNSFFLPFSFHSSFVVMFFLSLLSCMEDKTFSSVHWTVEMQEEEGSSWHPPFCV